MTTSLELEARLDNLLSTAQAETENIDLYLHQYKYLKEKSVQYALFHLALEWRMFCFLHAAGRMCAVVVHIVTYRL